MNRMKNRRFFLKHVKWKGHCTMRSRIWKTTSNTSDKKFSSLKKGPMIVMMKNTRGGCYGHAENYRLEWCECPTIACLALCSKGLHSLHINFEKKIVSTSAARSQQEGPEFKSPSWLGQGLSVRSLRVLLVSAWVLSRFSGFLPRSKDMHDRLKDNFGIFQPGPYFPMCMCVYDS